MASRPALAATARRRSGVVAMLLACVLVVRLLVPTGWMPVIAGDGAIRLTLCGFTAPSPEAAAAMEQAAERLGIDLDKNQPRDPGTSGADQPCAYAGIGFAALPQLDPPVILAPVAPRLPRLVAREVAIGRGLAAPPPPATGPPLFT